MEKSETGVLPGSSLQLNQQILRQMVRTLTCLTQVTLAPIDTDTFIQP